MKGLDLCWHEDGQPNAVISDWKRVKESGIDFVILRDGWGTDRRDPKLIEYAQEAQEAGIAVQGVYHFIYAINTQEVIRNAVQAIDNVKKAGLPKSTVIWCDIEESTIDKAAEREVHLTNQQLRGFAETFCNYCLSQGFCTGIYLNADYLIYRYGIDIMNEYDIWFADPYEQFRYPCLIKQNDWWGKVPGITGNVDCNIWEGNYTAGTARPRGDDKDMPHIVYTEKQLTDILRVLGSGNPPSSYSNNPPKNLLYWDGSRWWADCVNLYKALFNGRSIVNPAPGSFQSDLSNTGDVTEWGLMQQCTDKSQEFGRLGNQFRCLYMGGHFGGYLGFEWDEPNQGIVNVVEATPRWEDGIQYSYVDKNGARRWAKGRSAEGQWEWHGLATPWIDYSGSQPQPAPTPTPAKVPHLTTAEFIPYLGYVAKGSEGDIVEMLQKILKHFGYYNDVIDGFAGINTDKAIRAIQKDMGVDVDGFFGPQSLTALLK